MPGPEIVRDAGRVMERKGQPRVDDLPETRRGRRGPLPQWSCDGGFVVARFPVRIAPQGFAECRCLRGRFWPCEHRRISKLHVNLDEHQTTQQESFGAGSLFVEELSRCCMVWRLRIGSVEKQVRVGGQNHASPRCAMASASAQTSAGSTRKSPPQSSVGNCQPPRVCAGWGNRSTKCSAAFRMTSDNDQSCCSAISFSRRYSGSGN